MEFPKPIETVYKGYRFRSRLEARWAVFFDAIGIGWEYEREGYQLDAGWYLPDFWLPQACLHAEVKPEKVHGKDLERCEELALKSLYPILLLVGPPEEMMYELLLINGKDRSVKVPFFISGEDSKDGIILDRGEWYDMDTNSIISSGIPISTHQGVMAARSARFEFGESGA